MWPSSMVFWPVCVLTVGSLCVWLFLDAKMRSRHKPWATQKCLKAEYSVSWDWAFQYEYSVLVSFYLSLLCWGLSLRLHTPGKFSTALPPQLVFGYFEPQLLHQLLCILQGGTWLLWMWDARKVLRIVVMLPPAMWWPRSLVLLASARWLSSHLDKTPEPCISSFGRRRLARKRM